MLYVDGIELNTWAMVDILAQLVAGVFFIRSVFAVENSI